MDAVKNDIVEATESSEGITLSADGSYDLIIHKAYKFKLKPTEEQRQAMARTAGCCRWIYNWALNQRKEVFAAVKEHRPKERKVALKVINYKSQEDQLPGIKKQYPFLAEAHSQALQSSLEHLDDAFENFFKGAGFPKFKRKGKKDSFTQKQADSFEFNGQAIDIPNIGWVRYFNSRNIIGEQRSLTVSRDGNDWYASITTKQKIKITPKQLDIYPPVGLDVGVTKSMAFSDRTEIQLPVMTKDEEKELAWLQRLVSRKKKGSNRWWVAIGRVKNFRRHIANRVQDVRHNVTDYQSKNHGLVSGEALNVQNMMASASGTAENPGKNVAQKAGLNRVIGQQGFGETFRQFEYKCLWNGGLFLQVPAAGSSQRCFKCKHEVPENRLTQAVFRCVKCGYEANADFNAADNLSEAGLEQARKEKLLSTDGRTVAARGGDVAGAPEETRTTAAKAWRKTPPKTVAANT